MRYFPVKNKRPLISGWQTQATSDQSVLAEWAKAFPGCDWGVVCGEAEGIWVLDLDIKGRTNGLAALRAAGMSLEGLSYVTTKSGGYHVYFEWPKDGRSPATTVGVLEGVDVRANGSYVVMYEQDPVINKNNDQILSLVTKKTKNVTNQSVSNDEEVVEGGRNHYLTKVAGKLHRSGLLTFDTLMAVNTQKCSPPLEEAEVTLICNSVSRYASQDPIEKPQALLWARDLLTPMLDYLKDKDLVKGEPTGLQAMDKLLGGGKRLGELDVTVAEAKTGKNTLWHQLLTHWLNKGIKIGYASRELSPETEVMPNLLTIELKRNMLHAEEFDEAAIKAILDKWQLLFSPGYGSFPPEELLPWMDVAREAGVQHFFIDHLHYCLDDPEDYKAISIFIKKLKAYCKEHNVHIDLIVQPKVIQPGERLNLNSMRGGASIGQALDNLWTLMRVKDENGRKTNVVEVCLEAARSKLASLGSFYLEYNPITMTFREVVEDTTKDESEITKAKRIEP